MFKAFRDFIARGNVVDLAVGLIMGAAFGDIVKSLVNDVVMPPVGLLIGRIDFKNLKVVLAEASADGKTAEVAVRYGTFLNTVVSFLFVAIVVFLIVRAVSRLHAKPPASPKTKDCEFCKETIPLAATRCGHCTSPLPA